MHGLFFLTINPKLSPNNDDDLAWCFDTRESISWCVFYS